MSGVLFTPLYNIDGLWGFHFSRKSFLCKVSDSRNKTPPVFDVAKELCLSILPKNVKEIMIWRVCNEINPYPAPLEKTSD